MTYEVSLQQTHANLLRSDPGLLYFLAIIITINRSIKDTTNSTTTLTTLLTLSSLLVMMYRMDGFSSKLPKERKR